MSGVIKGTTFPLIFWNPEQDILLHQLIFLRKVCFQGCTCGIFLEGVFIFKVQTITGILVD